MKIVSLYLPQFHRTKENDEWWGEGYTDWEAVKKAEALFEGHYQPRRPYQDNYYNLLERASMEYQAKLMHEYNIYGQCFYHYWFKDGKKVLNKPAENLLKWKEIDIPFCFCWANESWVRSWSAIVDSNIWAPRFEASSHSENDNGILLEQDYGTCVQWEEHFDYFAVFFKDERYITIDGKPVIMIYRPDNIPCLEDMVACWQKKAESIGLGGVYVIGANTEKQRNMDATYVHATGSMFPPSAYSLVNGVKTIDYGEVWKYIIEVAGTCDLSTYAGGLVDFDTTARKGKNGVAITNCNPEIYKEGLMKLLKINEQHGLPFTFINAWNEWGEGMYLEPDSIREFSFLEATKNALADYHGIEIDNADNCSILQVYKEKVAQYKAYWKLMDYWMRKKECGISITDILCNRGYRTVAVYGIGILGQHLLKDININEVTVEYIIDIRKCGQYETTPIFNLEDNFPQVDVIIFRVTHEFCRIKSNLSRITNNSIISLEELVFAEVDK